MLLLSVLRTDLQRYEASIWSCWQFQKYFPLFLPNIIIPTFTSPHNSIWSTGEQISGSNMTYQIFWFKHAFCLLFLLIREEKVVMMMLGSKSGKYFWNYQQLHIGASYSCEFVLKTDRRSKTLFLFFFKVFFKMKFSKIPCIRGRFYWNANVSCWCASTKNSKPYVEAYLIRKPV